ncbi:hypothetical protein F2Q70_00032991 [Brassica cretica]|uniref:Uncharacterized protein n=1 Tax=Brassica cretica TaxID=69181 RepID=A0A8S9FJT0_BRACR|nr:hypothetical protein F2Q70_00032991 [Brassica cretica]
MNQQPQFAQSGLAIYYSEIQKLYITTQDTITKPQIAQTPNELLESLKTSLTVRTEGLDDGEDVFSFPNTPPFYDYGTPNDYFGGLMESSPIFDVVDWFNPTVEINPEFPTFLPDSIYY